MTRVYQVTQNASKNLTGTSTWELVCDLFIDSLRPALSISIPRLSTVWHYIYQTMEQWKLKYHTNLWCYYRYSLMCTFKVTFDNHLHTKPGAYSWKFTAIYPSTRSMETEEYQTAFPRFYCRSSVMFTPNTSFSGVRTRVFAELSQWPNQFLNGPVFTDHFYGTRMHHRITQSSSIAQLLHW